MARLAEGDEGAVRGMLLLCGGVRGVGGCGTSMTRSGRLLLL